MLNEGMVFATVAVKNLEESKKFYAETLGLRQVDENIGGVMYESGGSKVFIYESPSAGTNRATSATWSVDDIEAVVEELKKNGITFEHYDFPGFEQNGDIMDAGGMKTAWFKDPTGNILAVVNK